MNNKDAIRRVYDEIHAPDALFGKVMEMDMKKSSLRNVMKYAAGTAAALAIALVASNGICYAATGETWISKAIVYINGVETEMDVTWHENGDNVYGEIEVPVEDAEGSHVEVFSFVTDEELPSEVHIVNDEGYNTQAGEEGAYTQDAFTARMEQEGDKLFLVTDSERIDITEDFKDGEATGTFEYEGITVKYTVTGDVEACEISLTCE